MMYYEHTLKHSVVDYTSRTVILTFFTLVRCWWRLPGSPESAKSQEKSKRLIAGSSKRSSHRRHFDLLRITTVLGYVVYCYRCQVNLKSSMFSLTCRGLHVLMRHTALNLLPCSRYVMPAANPLPATSMLLPHISSNHHFKLAPPMS